MRGRAARFAPGACAVLLLTSTAITREQPEPELRSWRIPHVGEAAEHYFGNRDIFMMNLETTQQRRLTTHDGVDGFPAISHDGADGVCLEPRRHAW